MTPQVTLTDTTALAALLGAGTGIGLLTVITGWRGVDAPRTRLRHRPRGLRGDQQTILRTLVAAGVGVATGVLTGWVVGAMLAGVGCWALPRVLGRDREHDRRIARIEAIATWTEMLRDTLSAAAGLEQAILATAPLAPHAIRGEITDLATGLNNGDRLVPSLRTLADRLADPTGDLVIAALVLAAGQHARQLGDLLGSLAQASREQASMRMRVAAGRARTRTSVRMIVGTTLGFAVAMVALNRSYLSAYDTATGQLVLLVIGALFALGFAWLARIATDTDEHRVLAGTPAQAEDHSLATTRQGDSA